MPLPPDLPPQAHRHGAFPNPPWSELILEGSEPEEAHSAWERFALTYWQPLYIFLRRRGVSHDAAADDIQGFFAHLLSRDFLRQIERGEVLFRSFLLTALRSWRADQYRGANAQKRGGGIQPVPLEELEKAGEMPMAEEGFARGGL